jgi:hypothetical protein
LADQRDPAPEQEPTSDPYTSEEPAQFADPYAAPADPHEGAVPPGYDWPTHGGYLGCLMGLIAACLVAGFVGSFVIGIISVSPLGGLVGTPFARITLLVLAFAVCFGVLGRVGWVFGRRFYREYPQPTPRDRMAGSAPTATDERRHEHEGVV